MPQQQPDYILINREILFSTIGSPICSVIARPKFILTGKLENNNTVTLVEGESLRLTTHPGYDEAGYDEVVSSLIRITFRIKFSDLEH